MYVESNNELMKKTIFAMLSFKIDESNVRQIGGMCSDYMFDCGYSMDGKKVVVNDGSNVYVFDIKTKRLSRTLKNRNSSDWVISTAFSKDRQKLATSSDDNSLSVYSLRNFSVLDRIKNDTYICAICFSHCSKYIYFSDANRTLKKWDIEKSNIVWERTIHYLIWKLNISYDNKYFLIADGDKTVGLIDSQNFSVFTINHDDYVKAIECHPTMGIIAIGDKSNKVRLWNTDSLTLLHTFIMEGQVGDLHFLSPVVLGVMSGDGYLTLYSMENFQEIQRICCGCDGSNFLSFAISPNMRWLVCGKCPNNTIRMFSIVSQCDSSHHSKIIELSKDGGHVLSNLIAMKVDTQIIRQLVAAGICMNREEFDMIVDLCWDLIDFNEAKGGNMYSFVGIQMNENNDDDCSV
eukprot:TRINITY_DN3293_c3_g2_i2.p1 TRINITY_DN3293_c3_g2~~TRINITY_DN3293_c3_g2_i2.p1  ORF type:complete len:405 (+),score=79.20 TRINITY_DN3293_c3_g2_i2:366-1580(+)